MERPIFNSRDPAYKVPFGAVSCGRLITFRLCPPAEEHIAAAWLVLYREFADMREEFPFSPADTEDTDAIKAPHTVDAQPEPGDGPIFSLRYRAPEEPELIWYCFRFAREDGSQVWLGKNGLCGDGQAACWQQTVYDNQLSTPEWFGKGVTYQIFPDRFHRTFVPDPAGMLGDRVVHQNWEELMEYLPDEHGEIRNRDFFGGSLMGIEEKLP